MGTSGFGSGFQVIVWLTVLLRRFGPCSGGLQSVGQISPGLQGTQMNWVDHDGVFLRSNNSEFGFGFTNPGEVTQYFLAIIHLSSRKIVWTANQLSPVSTSDKFVFEEGGNVVLYKENNVVWSTNTTNRGVSVLALMDSGNLALLGNDSSMIWESFAHPTDTLLSNQGFVEGMRLVSKPDQNNLTYVLELKSGDMILSAGFKSPQPYWSMSKENRKTINKDGGSVISATLTANSWNFHGGNNVLLWQFAFSTNTDANATWMAVLGSDGFISFYKLQMSGSGEASSIRIPEDPCGTPQPCGPNFICYSENKCLCPSILGSQPNCQTGITAPCDQSIESTELVESHDKIGYFALQFLQPSVKTDLENCKSSCRTNCSCIALFYHSSGDCFLLDQIGGFQNPKNSEFVSFIKLSRNQENGGNGSAEKKPIPAILGIAISTLIIISGLIYIGIRYVRKKNKSPEAPQESSEEENFLEGLSGAPIRYSYKDLQTATDNFLVKLGQGGFGSVYRGVLPDGTRLAVKKLEGIGQGKKEFRAEVGIIGSIHHIHLVRLKGFCAEGTHRLLAYEFMANGSLDKWIFKKNREDFSLDWDTRFNIAVGTAKGLAYLHEDCDAKIVHCDIKPENVLLDDNFQAKVSDFGLAKLMNREQSHVFTTLRGTRGYLAPEWITNYAISEKSDVYSYGMVLLEIIGGRKNYDPTESSEKSHFPTYAFKMMEEGKLRAVLDAKLNINENDERVFVAIKVALWCVQEDMQLRPSMARVVQMLEGVSAVPQPPTSSPLGSRLFSGFLKSSSEEWTSSGPSDCNSDAYLSSVQLSGPR
ncbi:G-type lectin S-receptor-like serine/threonine-protein kinase SD2-5 [Cucurbita maxima]|uniref:Receptor-like serine/threonine-protein kinase n=1 Tax=Cucurbita maxima TaxID=3661 RepID=A0A6J1KND8_CUCMA|nr:G-type lectin S-receptor-like serine/threonine-protein kinase SD2-5 [Cucurbita maxima]